MGGQGGESPFGLQGMKPEIPQFELEDLAIDFTFGGQLRLANLELFYLKESSHSRSFFN